MAEVFARPGHTCGINSVAEDTKSYQKQGQETLKARLPARVLAFSVCKIMLPKQERYQAALRPDKGCLAVRPSILDIGLG